MPPPLLHHLDESPVGYSLAGCCQAEGASASPTGRDFEIKGFRRTMRFQGTANRVLTARLRPGVQRKIPYGVPVLLYYMTVYTRFGDSKWGYSATGNGTWAFRLRIC